MSEPIAEGSVAKMKIRGNTNKSVQCKKVELYEDKLKILKGNILSKGWKTIYYRDIEGIEDSWTKTKILTDSNDYTFVGGAVITQNEELIMEQTKTAGQSSGSEQVSDAEELEKFAELKEKGVITEEEFEKKKSELL